MTGREPSPQLALDFRWDAEADLAAFVPGANAEAIAAVRAVASGKGPPVHLHGGPGTGKSHLLQAACGEVSAAGAAAFYLPLAAMRRYPPQVLEGLEQVALVAVDDLGALAGDEDWQEALFHLYNRLRETGAGLLTAGAQPPEGLGLALADLVSRLQWGLVYRLQAPDDGTCVEALARRAARRGLTLPTSSARYLVERFPRDTHGLFARLDRLDEASLRAGRRLTIPFIREILGPVPGSRADG